MPVKKKPSSKLKSSKTVDRKTMLIISVVAIALVGIVALARSFAAVSTGVYKGYVISEPFLNLDGARLNQKVTTTNSKSPEYYIVFSRNSFAMTKEKSTPPRGDYFFCVNYAGNGGLTFRANGKETPISMPKSGASYARSCASVYIDGTREWTWSLTNYNDAITNVDKITLETSSTTTPPPSK